MGFKNQKYITPSQRHLVQLTKTNLKKKPLLKTKIKGIRNINGRNHSGKITVRHKGGGHKRKYRTIEFTRNYESTGITSSIEYDPNRNTYIASVYEVTKKKFFYIIAPKNLKVGDIIESGPNSRINLGNALPISAIPVGSLIYNVSPTTTTEGQIARSAGTFAILKEKILNSARIELSSKEHRLIHVECYATLGVVSNELIFFTRKGKAGRARWLNTRPTTRGVAMNPVDHPHGGGEGKTSGKGKTPWGIPVKKGKTSNSRNKNIITRRYE